MSFRTSTSSTTLCLACSSSLPPLKVSASHSIHITSCCQRPICPSCITANPRLARYNPCLACLGGVGAVASKLSLVTPPVSGARSPGLALNSNSNLNIDGAVRDEDTFVLGDDDDDYSDNDEIVEGQGMVDNPHEMPTSRPILPPPPYDPTSIPPLLDSKPQIHTLDLEPPQDLEETPASPHTTSNLTGNITNEPFVSSSPTENSQKTRTVPYKYYLNRNDTLQGLSLRFGLDVSCERFNRHFFIELVE